VLRVLSREAPSTSLTVTLFTLKASGQNAKREWSIKAFGTEMERVGYVTFKMEYEDRLRSRAGAAGVVTL
jgi:hypothetical protein